MRKKQQKPSKYHGNYKNYSTEALENAYKVATTSKTSVRKVALQFGVPYQTLRDRVTGKVVHDQKGSTAIFSIAEEEVIVGHAEKMAKLGYGMSNKDMQKTAGELAFHLGKRNTDKPLSNCWLYGFLERWKSRIASMKPSALDSTRAKQTTPECVDAYFYNLKQVVEELGLTDKPHLIYNLDETGINPEHRPPNVIAPLKEKTQAVTSPRSGTTTVIGCVNAAGNHLPPYFVFKGKRMNDELMTGASPGARGVMSDSGWSTIKVFQDYMENHFLKYVDTSTPVLLILDGHTTHTSPATIKWAMERNIHLFVLPAHSSHVLQPLDVAVFGPFKRYYYSECALHMKSNMGKCVTKYDMAALACKAYLKAVAPVNILSGFKRTGIAPYCREAIPAERLFPCEPFRDNTPLQKVDAIKKGKDAIQEYLSSKMARSQSLVPSSTKQNVSSRRPSSSGREITTDVYIHELNIYESEKENRPPVRQDSQQSKKSKCSKKIPLSPLPSTSGLNNKLSDSDEDSDDESQMSLSDLCCVCGQFSPADLSKKPYLKLVSWGQCDECGHWVHLSFCHQKTVLRKGDDFLCIHCC